mgnify:CR=1 FL=1
MDKRQEKLNNLLDLLAMRSCQPLSYTEELELNHLLDEFPEYTPDYFEPITALADSTMYIPPFPLLGWYCPTVPSTSGCPS